MHSFQYKKDESISSSPSPPPSPPLPPPPLSPFLLQLLPLLLFLSYCLLLELAKFDGSGVSSKGGARGNIKNLVDANHRMLGGAERRETMR